MTELITVADLVRKCQEENIPTDEAILLVERDYPVPVVDADFSYGSADGHRWVGFLLDTPNEEG